MKSIIDKLKSSYFFSPITIIWKHKMEFLLWFVFVIFAGQMGTFINIVGRVVFGDLTLMQSLLADSDSGNFYTYALVLISSLVGSLFIRIILPTEPEHRRLVVPFATISFVMMIFSAVFFSFTTIDTGKNYEYILNNEITFDGWQVGIFIIAILIAIYAFGLERVHKHREWDEFDKYKDEENANVKSLNEKYNKIDKFKEIKI